MDKFNNSLEVVQVLLTLDVKCDCFQTQMDKSDLEKTDFKRHNGVYQFTRMALSLNNSPATIQRVMDIILSLAKLQFTMVYLDDINIFSKLPAEQISQIEKSF